MLHMLTNMLSPEVLAVVFWIFRIGFYVSCAAALFTGLRSGRSGTGLFGGYWPAVFASAFAFVAVLAYQASWQLAGFTKPEFIEFMEIHNRRQDNVAHNVVRGTILDCKGRVLAETDVKKPAIRVYPYGPAAAHIVGFRVPGGESAGMENAADGLLSGYEHPHAAISGEMMNIGANVFKNVRKIGTNIVLTIDAELQDRAYRLMDGRRGAVVVIEPESGAIRALLSSPSFDPNAYDRGLCAAPDAPLLNRALHGLYPAGSVFKTVIAALAVQSGIPLRIDCPASGYCAPGARRPIRDHEYYSYEKQGLKWNGFGCIGLDDALAKSSNTYFANAGVRCGADAFNSVIKQLMLNDRILIFRGTNGMLSARASKVPVLKRGELRELSQLSIGQGRLLVTPFHMALSACAVANDGVIMRPRILEMQPQSQMTRAYTAAAARRVRDAMRNVVLKGTARKADIPGVNVCAKTGTAQNPGGADHSWFLCFASSGGKKLAVAVIVENSGFGSAQALPVAVGILQTAFGIKTEPAVAAVQKKPHPATEKNRAAGINNKTKTQSGGRRVLFRLDGERRGR